MGRRKSGEHANTFTGLRALGPQFSPTAAKGHATIWKYLGLEDFTNQNHTFLSTISKIHLTTSTNNSIVLVLHATLNINSEKWFVEHGVESRDTHLLQQL